MYKIYITLTSGMQFVKGFFTGWNDGGTANYTLDSTAYSSGKEMSSTECMHEFIKLTEHYQPLEDKGIISGLAIQIYKDTSTIITLEELKESVLSDVKGLGAMASFDATKMTNDEKLAIFYITQYIAMQEIGNSNRSILFRDYIKQQLPSSMQTEANGIVGAFPNLSAEILGNEKHNLIQDDEPEQVEYLEAPI